jgi:probable addiction module antidote protein
MKKPNTDYKADLVERLKNKKYALGFLRESFLLSLEDGDGAAFQLALKDVVEAQGGVAVVAKRAHLQRENTYRILSKERNPRFDSILKLSKAVGFTPN